MAAARRWLERTVYKYRFKWRIFYHVFMLTLNHDGYNEISYIMQKTDIPQKHAHLRHEKYHFHYGLLHYSGLFFVEIMMALIVVIGLATFFYSYLADPTAGQRILLYRITIGIGGLLLVEFLARFWLSKHKLLYLKHNWWYVLASLPIAAPAASALRAVRLLGLVKMIKIGVHLKLDESLLEELEAPHNSKKS